MFPSRKKRNDDDDRHHNHRLLPSHIVRLCFAALRHPTTTALAFLRLERELLFGDGQHVVAHISSQNTATVPVGTMLQRFHVLSELKALRDLIGSQGFLG